MSAEQVALIPRCAECDALWLPADEERWSAYLTDDEPPGVIFYCPECAEREFGHSLRLNVGDEQMDGLVGTSARACLSISVPLQTLRFQAFSRGSLLSARAERGN